jgi:diadenylate cyclase
MLDALGAVAPGKPLREGLDRILQANMGALIVVGDGPEVLNICSGGFLLDAAYSPQRLSELAKMDGAIILAADASRIARANVHLVPNPNTPTSETGTRHRTAERVARSINLPVISVSEDMAIIAVYKGDAKVPLEPIPRLLNRANTALQTLERYKSRLDEVSKNLSALEVEDMVTIRDVVVLLQRMEMVLRIAEEIETDIVELGVDGRLVRLQLEEVMGGVEDERRMVIRDYFREDAAWHLDEAMAGLTELDTDALLDLKSVGEMLHLAEGVADLDAPLQPKGYRLLGRIPRLPDPVIDAIVARFTSLPKIMRATIDDLDDVDGVGDTRARAIKAGIAPLAEASIRARYTCRGGPRRRGGGRPRGGRPPAGGLGGGRLGLHAE